MNKDKKFILETFIQLTSETYPYGHEDIIMEKMVKLGLVPDSIEKDQHGNYFLKLGDSKTIFASHLDTVSKDYTQVKHIIENNIVKTDGLTTLGADDKAGVTIMLWMIKHNVPGLYYFFIGEEVGCVGSGLAAKYGDFKNYDRIISFDRRGTDSVITYQSSERCCSDAFAKQLSKELNNFGLSYKPDDTGVYTDSAEFTSIIPECTNLSVGYYKEHTTGENQDILHLEKLADACVLINWESLVTKRDPSKSEYKTFSYTNYSTTYNNNSSNSYSNNNWRSRDYGYYDDFYSSSRNKKRNRRSKNKSYHDDWYDQSSVGKSYYDGGGELIEIKSKTPKSKTFSKYSYDWVMEKFLGKTLTEDELKTIRDQYLDMDVESDRAFFEYLVETSIEQNQ